MVESSHDDPIVTTVIPNRSSLVACWRLATSYNTVTTMGKSNEDIYDRLFSAGYNAGMQDGLFIGTLVGAGAVFFSMIIGKTLRDLYEQETIKATREAFQEATQKVEESDVI